MSHIIMAQARLGKRQSYWWTKAMCNIKQDLFCKLIPDTYWEHIVVQKSCFSQSNNNDVKINYYALNNGTQIDSQKNALRYSSHWILSQHQEN